MFCSHVKANGETCEALAIRNQTLCYFHQRALNAKNIAGRSNYRFPTLEDPLSIQLGIVEIMRGIVLNRLSERTGKMLLSAMKIAAGNVSRCSEQSKKPRKPVQRASEANDANDFDPILDFA